MYLRTIKAKSRTYVSIVRGYRDAQGKSRQKTIQNLGFFNTESEKEKLYETGKKIIANMNGLEIVDVASDINVKSESNWGAGAVIDQLMEKFALNEVIDNLISSRKIEFNLIKSLQYLLISRIIDPKSKLASYDDCCNYDGFEDISLHHLYRTLDELAFYKDKLCEHLFRKQSKLCKNVDVVLFDVTTLYFESKKADDLREFGFSKDCKFSEVQVVLSLVVTSCGRPIAYQIFPGNTFEGKTLLPCLIDLKQKYNIKNVTIVADRGMSSLQNLSSIKEAGFDYIVAHRIKSESKVRQNTILSEDGYQMLKNLDDGFLKYKVMDCAENDKLLCVYSSKRAKKDASDRVRALEQASVMIKNKSYKRKNGAKKYINFSENDDGTINEAKVANDARFDGYYAISYSKAESTPNDILLAYHNLWKIEESFRTMKHFLQVRPMFHWTAKRIIGHVMLNFISLIFDKDLELSLNLTQTEIRKAILSMKKSRLHIANANADVFALPNKNAISMMQKLGIKMPQNKKL